MTKKLRLLIARCQGFVRSGAEQKLLASEVDVISVLYITSIFVELHSIFKKASVELLIKSKNHIEFPCFYIII